MAPSFPVRAVETPPSGNARALVGVQSGSLGEGGSDPPFSSKRLAAPPAGGVAPPLANVAVPAPPTFDAGVMFASRAEPHARDIHGPEGVRCRSSKPAPTVSRSVRHICRLQEPNRDTLVRLRAVHRRHGGLRAESTDRDHDREGSRVSSTWRAEQTSDAADGEPRVVDVAAARAPARADVSD